MLLLICVLKHSIYIDTKQDIYSFEGYSFSAIMGSAKIICLYKIPVIQ